ncbi:MAG: PqqD family protein [Paludibacteraceae bacterium]|nr:PqqD family protein [Paludibacteraceae bacterium]
MNILKGFKLRPLGNEYILVGEGIEQINFNKMITMNETAAYLWHKVEDGSDFDANRLAALLTEEYEVSQEQALKDAQTTIESWQTAGIIK